MTTIQNGEARVNLQRDIIKKHLHLHDDESIKLTLNFLAELHSKSSSSFQAFHERVKQNGGEDFDATFLREIYSSLGQSQLEGRNDGAFHVRSTLRRFLVRSLRVRSSPFALMEHSFVSTIHRAFAIYLRFLMTGLEPHWLICNQIKKYMSRLLTKGMTTGKNFTLHEGDQPKHRN